MLTGCAIQTSLETEKTTVTFQETSATAKQSDSETTPEQTVYRGWYEVKMTCLNPDRSVEFISVYEYEAGKRAKQTTTNSDGIINYYENYKYDNNGNKLLEEQYSKNGELSKKTEYKYNESNRAIEKMVYKENGELKMKTLYEYDEDGNISREKYYSASLDEWEELSYTYDEDGNVLTYKKDGEINRFEYKFDDKGNVVEEKFFTNNNNQFSIIYYKYDENNNIIKETTKYFVELTDNISVYEYDAFGNMTMETQYNTDGDIKRIYTHEYEMIKSQ